MREKRAGSTSPSHQVKPQPRPRAVTPQVSSLAWDRCPVCAGMRVQFAAEQVPSFGGIRKVALHRI